jgi:hypothetical protein
MPGKPARKRRRARDCQHAATSPISGPPLAEEAAAAFRFARETARGERRGCIPGGERAHRFEFTIAKIHDRRALITKGPTA